MYFTFPSVRQPYTSGTGTSSFSNRRTAYRHWASDILVQLPHLTNRFISSKTTGGGRACEAAVQWTLLGSGCIPARYCALARACTSLGEGSWSHCWKKDESWTTKLGEQGTFDGVSCMCSPSQVMMHVALTAVVQSLGLSRISWIHHLLPTSCPSLCCSTCQWAVWTPLRSPTVISINNFLDGVRWTLKTRRMIEVWW